MCLEPGCCYFFRVAHVGGNFNNGAKDGLFYWNFNNSSSNSNWNIGARLLILHCTSSSLPLGKNVSLWTGLVAPFERKIGRQNKKEIR